MLSHKSLQKRAFTLIELLVVVAIIALLISVLLPSLQNAREKARAAKCGVMLKQMGIGLETYYSENDEWIPGLNTTGVALRMALLGGGGEGALRSPHMPVQIYDWVTPFMRYETELGANRALRIQTIVNEYSCPSVQNDRVDFIYGLDDSDTHDDADFANPDGSPVEYAPLSYLMPMQFQWWGQRLSDHVIASGLSSAQRPIKVGAETAPSFFEAYHEGFYQSRRDQVGQASRKIAAADGTRYLVEDGSLDFDVDPIPDWYGLLQQRRLVGGLASVRRENRHDELGRHHDAAWHERS